MNLYFQNNYTHHRHNHLTSQPYLPCFFHKFIYQSDFLLSNFYCSTPILLLPSCSESLSFDLPFFHNFAKVTPLVMRKKNQKYINTLFGIHQKRKKLSQCWPTHGSMFVFNLHILFILVCLFFDLGSVALIVYDELCILWLFID